MDKQCQEFLDRLMAASPGFKEVNVATLNYWEPDPPPVTTLFSAFGERIIDDLNNFSVEKRKSIFGQIEAAMVSGDTPLVTAVATGLVEGMVSRAVSDEEVLAQIKQLMGDRTRKHVDAWLDGC